MKVRRRAFPDGALACPQVRDVQAALAGGGLSAEQALLPRVQHPLPLVSCPALTSVFQG